MIKVVQGNKYYFIKHISLPLGCFRPTQFRSSIFILDPDQRIYSFNQTVKIKCDVDYVLVGNDRKICLTNGSWAGENPSCWLKGNES